MKEIKFTKDIIDEILREQKEVIQQSGIRIQVVETSKIKEVFEKRGITFLKPF